MEPKIETVKEESLLRQIMKSNSTRISIYFSILVLIVSGIQWYTVTNKSALDVSPYSTRIVRRLSPEVQCPGDSVRFDLETTINRPVILSFYKTWFNDSTGRTLVAAPIGSASVAQYPRAIVLNSMISETIPISAPLGSQILFLRGIRAEGSRDYIQSFPVTIGIACKGR